MKEILKYVPGFRSDKTWKKIAASIYYSFTILFSLIIGLDFLLIAIGALLFVMSITDFFTYRKRGLTIKTPVITLVLAIVLIGSGGSMEKTEIEVDKQMEIENEEVKTKDKKIDKVNEELQKEKLEITGDLNIEFKDNRAIATITTNVIDGSIFETSIMDANFNTVSDFISIENGKGIKEFDINKDWEIGYISGIAMMRFNLDDHPQTEEVKEVYGENGEQLKGDLAEENNVGGYNINLDSKTVAYPDEVTVKTKLKELFDQAIKEVIEISNGVIINIQPYLEDNNWSAVAVTVSDAWYNSQEHEKERFAEQISETVITLVKNGGKVEKDKTVMVYLFDSYKKELASPKIMGGYKIKR